MGEELSLADVMEKNPIEQVGEQWLAAAATLLHQQGDAEAALTATDVIAVDLSLWNSGDFEPDGYRAFFTVEPHLVAQFTENVLRRIEDGMHAVMPKRTAICIESIHVCPVVPVPSADWRKQLRSANGPKPTNQARRVRLEPEHPIEDQLHFTNEWEHKLYRVLKERQASLPYNETIGIIPLPGMRVLGYTREPDFLITYKGRAGVIEVDGPHHEGPRRASNDHSRTNLLMNAGVEWVDRIDVRDVTKAEAEKFVDNFIARLARR
ncbi:hypothetical protein [Streptomyces sp. Isolate_219]|uniref:hypothetical protein n=1 Tax=Streptomyces sp. Isolate_219 TaxID=2950110 RepID=UPI0021C8E065|nr:hypothetical protein [Streptomyces sp. Isolate_219]MCR8573095.1 hypothetical protein [Streptomyces sp. Isolate_219]